MKRVNFWSVFIGLAIACGVITFMIFSCGDDGCDSRDGQFRWYVFTHFGPLLFGLIFVGGTFMASRDWAAMDSLVFKLARSPQTAIANITDDVPIQFNGAIASEKTLASPSTKTPCVFYHYIKERYEGSGDDARWVIKENKCDFIPFDVADKTGSIEVDLTNVDSDLGNYQMKKKKTHLPDYQNSEIDAEKTVFQKASTEETKVIIFSGKQSVRESEYVLRPGANVFVSGWSFKENGKLHVREQKDWPLIVSRKSKDDYLEDFAKGDSFFYASNALFGLGIALFYLFLVANVLLPFIREILLALGLGFIAFRFIYGSFNRMVELNNRCENSLKQIDIEWQRRLDLIPNLEVLVKAYSRYERQTQVLITELRGKSLMLDKEAKSVIAVMESNPKLKADKSFQNFFARLVETEDNLAYYRGFYLRSARKYNSLIQSLPFSLIAMPFHFKPRGYFEAIE